MAHQSSIYQHHVKLPAGLLYESGDYASAVAQIKSLIEDKAFAEHVAQGGRSEVERWGWSAATKTLRLNQYGRAIRNKVAYRRLVWLSIRTNLLRLLYLPIYLIRGMLAALIRFLDYAQQHRSHPV